jgi:hydroxypyruvate isomerase
MPRFAANLSLLFTEHAFLDRFAAAAAAGFRAVEFQFPYGHEAEDIREAAAAADVPVVLFNIGAGDLMEGGPGLAAMPERRSAFGAAVDQAIHYAEILKPGCLNVLAGVPPAEADREACLDTLVANLQRAADGAAELGITVTAEFINTESRPGFLLSTADQTVAALDMAGRPNLAMQFDLYHAAIMEPDPLAALRDHLPRIAHIQFADYPGRGEPGTGQLDFETFFLDLDRLGYAGWVGAEYNPSHATEETLEWLKKWQSEDAS